MGPSSQTDEQISLSPSGWVPPYLLPWVAWPRPTRLLPRRPCLPTCSCCSSPNTAYVCSFARGRPCLIARAHRPPLPTRARRGPNHLARSRRQPPPAHSPAARPSFSDVAGPRPEEAPACPSPSCVRRSRRRPRRPRPRRRRAALQGGPLPPSPSLPQTPNRRRQGRHGRHSSA